MLIWFAFAAIAILAILYVSAPLYGRVDSTETSEEIERYKTELKALNTKISSGNEDDNLATKKRVLETQLIKAATRTEKTAHPVPSFVLIAGSMLFALSGAALYSVIGSPELADKSTINTPVLSADQALTQSRGVQTAPIDPDHDGDVTMEELVTRLETKLEDSPNNPQGWILYARSLMTLRRFEPAFKAYEKTLALTDNNPTVLEEYESAKAFAAQETGQAAPNITSQPGPSADDVRAAQDMNSEDRNAMIQGMVDGLSVKLEDNPNDPSGWIRLLRARKVLNQTDTAQAEIIRMKQQFSDKPLTIARILTQSGWDAVTP